MNHLLKELNIHTSIASSMIHKIQQKETIDILEKYEIPVLKELNNILNLDANDLCMIVHDRRMAYVEKVRKYSNGGRGFIDLSSDQDDTANLSHGITAIYRVMDKIDKIIFEKMNVIKEKEKENYENHMCNMITMGLITIPLLYIFFL